ncbi:MAG: response regulator [bacterium]
MATEPRHLIAAPISNGRITPAIRLDGLHVLLVDDDTEQLALLSELLSEVGADVHPATSAHEAVRVLAQQSFDVVVSDINMPDCDGYHLLRMIRARPGSQGGEAPAIALTGHGTDSGRTRAHLAGYQVYLLKPVRLIELITAIRDVVRTDVV